MTDLFLKIVNMSISASWLVLAVLLIRFVFKKAPKWGNVLLWGIVAVRLICPLSIESALSLIPSAETIPQEVLSGPSFDVQTGIAPVDNRINDYLGDRYFEGVTVPANNGSNVMTVLTIVWLVGVLILVTYTAISYWHLRRKVSEATVLRDNVYQSENVPSPFVLGIIKPKIYLPYGMDEQNLCHVVAHEKAHIRRRDHWWKPLGFFLLTIHWFNPLMWLAYVLLCRDIELACDEKVIKELGNKQRADYTQALVVCSVKRLHVAACPLAFGEVGVKERVKSVMNYKKPTFWIIGLSVIACAVVAICFLTNPVAEIDFSGVESVTVDNISVSDKAAEELMTLINSHRRTHFMVGLDDPNSLSRAIQINCANGDFYLLHYQYYSGFSFDPRHAGEDDYRSILTFFNASEGGQKAWKMEYDFDNELREWLSEYTTPNFGALTVNLPFCVVEVTYETPLMEYSSVAQVNTPEYMLDENKHFYYVKQHSDAPNWTDLGELSEITLTKWNFDKIFRRDNGEGWLTHQSAAEIRRNTAKTWCVIFNQDQLYYVLQQNNGELYLAQGYYDYSEKNDPYSDDTSIHRLYKIAPIEKQESSKHEANTITNIVDPTKDENFAYDTAVEKFFDDENNEYFFSGIYSQYVIVHYEDGTMEDIVTALSSGRATIADLDRFGIRYWAEPKMNDLSAAITSAILNHNKSADPDGLHHCASFVLLTQLEVCFDSDPPMPNQVTVYGIALHQAYSLSGGTLYEVWGSHIPVAITFEFKEGVYRLLEYWEPRDGIYYEADIRDKFPDDVESDAMDLPKYILTQKQDCYEQAVAYSGMDVNSVIEQLFEVIESSPLQSSRPGDYIDAHPIEYRELMWYGNYTLQYIFSKFLEGGQFGLRGHIMRALLDDLAPEAQLRLYAMTGQEYFDEWKAAAIRVSEQHDMEWIKENQNAIWLLLQMISE